MHIDLLGFFKTFFEPQFSRVSSVREKEEQAYLFFLRYVEECEGMYTVHTYNVIYFGISQHIVM